MLELEEVVFKTVGVSFVAEAMGRVRVLELYCGCTRARRVMRRRAVRLVTMEPLADFTAWFAESDGMAALD